MTQNLGRIAPRDRGSVSTHNVVPANAGTHTPCRSFWEMLFEGFRATTQACGYGSRRSPIGVKIVLRRGIVCDSRVS